jgi:small GTP-binding protein
MIRKKILLIGDFNVGKTSLIRRYVDNTFDDKYLTTIGVKISKKRLIVNDEEYELLIWDIEGATPQKPIPKTYYSGASGAVFVGDISRADTIEHIQNHVQTFIDINRKSSFVVAYNKADLLSSEQIEGLVLEKNTFLTSAKEDKNVEEMFLALAMEMEND